MIKHELKKAMVLLHEIKMADKRAASDIFQSIAKAEITILHRSSVQTHVNREQK
jgi:hypothetical protein